MRAVVQVTNKPLYESKVADLEHQLEILDAELFSGQVLIHTHQGHCIPFYGLLSAEEYEKDYGFRLAIELSLIHI